MTDSCSFQGVFSIFIILVHLAICHLSKCGDITEAELTLGKERVFVARQRRGLRACLSARVLFPVFIRNILASDFVLAARSAGR